jgi:hypothetical protein
MKTYGNVILMAMICIVIFWVFMALRPANAATVRCGSSWELCAQRGKGPGSKFDPTKTTRGNQRQIREGFDRK